MRKNIHTNSKKKQALALLRERRVAEARTLYMEICRIDPLDAEAWFRLGTAHLELSAVDRAENCFRRVIELEPRLAIAYYNLGRSLELQGKDDEAIVIYRKLLRITPNIEAYYNIGVIYARQGKFAEALDIYREAQRIQPDNPRLIAAEASVYQMQRDYERAYVCIRPLLEAGRESPEVAMLLAWLSGQMNCRSQAIDMLERQIVCGDLAGKKDVLIPLHFTLGKLLDDAGEYDRAFRHFRRGNELTGNAFDPKLYAEYVDAIIATFNADFVRRSPRASGRADQLIFIVGMPRSGTTLLEQILDSHPQVRGCGELSDIGDMAYALPETLGIKERYPQGVVSLTTEHCDKLAERYLRRVKALSAGAGFVTDKMPQNFNVLGLIAQLFPGAKVIHCMRDPLDTCLSCYFQYFRLHHTAMAFSTDLAHLGAYYRQYQRLMEHWRTVLDIPMLDVSYEKLVADQEQGTREILAFCGLQWDERCLKFYESGRFIDTASLHQVAKPIYQKSVLRWKHYEPYLEPLMKALLD
jgi:tetratricopeptide (TPR) repeat protein